MAKDGPDTAVALRARALRLLARREHSRAELARKLAPGAESPAALAELLDSLEQKRQLSDARYAEARVRQLSRKYGAARIRQDLKANGVGGDLIDGVSGEGELERARAILDRKYRSPAATREERAKRMRFLQSRGFASDVIFRLLSSRFDPAR
ncbi:MAG: recombination regulator RecX [Betaproteobacteria bacterium]|nr:recombination regulator RecX [Betaproteobacteria bacterium]